MRVHGSDAISVRFEHRDGGPAMEVMQRYTKKRFRGGIEYGATSVHSTDFRHPRDPHSTTKVERGGRSLSVGTGQVTERAYLPNPSTRFAADRSWRTPSLCANA